MYLTAMSLLFILGLVISYYAVFTEPPEDLDSSPEQKVARVMAGQLPEIRTKPLDPYPANAGTENNFSFIIRDNDSAELNLTWDWGDGIVETTNVSGTPGTNIRIYRYHTYNPPYEPGRSNYNVSYFFNLTVEDWDLNSVYELTEVNVTVPVTNISPGDFSLAINETIVDPSAEVYIMASVVDAEGEALTWTFTFNDSVQDYDVKVFHTNVTAPGERVWNNVTHVFGTVGLHKVTLNVSDALQPYQVWPHNVSHSFSVNVAINNVPQVSSVIGTNPTDLIVNLDVGYAQMEYSVQAFDQDGDVLTLTWNFDDGQPEEINVSVGGTSTYTFVQIRNYTDEGVFNVTVNVTDGRPGHTVSLYKVVTVLSTNAAPSLRNAAPTYWGNGSFGAPNQTVNFTLKIYDAEEDPLTVMVDFGDGSPKLFANLTEFVDGNTTLTFQHSYERIGNYTVHINYTDSKIGLSEHDMNVTLDVKIYEPRPYIPVIWDWWDYTSLSLFCMIPVIAVVRFVMVGRQRKQLEKEGMTLEEWKLITGEKAQLEKEKKP